MKKKARSLRTNQTDAERLLWERLRNRELMGCKFRRQHVVGRYIVDFICLEQCLVVELDGGQHVVQLEYDGHRTEFLVSRGFRVMRFWNHDVLQRTETVVEVIQQALEHPPSPQPSPQSGEGEKIR